MNASSDRIEREILLQAPVSRVWRALSNAEEFGNWFGVTLRGQTFVVGQHTKGMVTHPGYEHLVWDVLVERLEPRKALAFRWHPYAVDAQADYSSEPTTLVEFLLSDLGDTTLLTLIESGFDQIPPERRLEAYRMNSGGWDIQMQTIARHVATP